MLGEDLGVIIHCYIIQILTSLGMRPKRQCTWPLAALLTLAGTNFYVVVEEMKRRAGSRSWMYAALILMRNLIGGLVSVIAAFLLEAPRMQPRKQGLSGKPDLGERSDFNW